MLIRYALSCLLSGILLGCSSPEGLTFQPMEKSYSLATLYLIGDSWSQQSVVLNDQEPISLDLGNVHVALLQPGWHRIHHLQGEPGHYRIRVEAGKEYILKLSGEILRPGTFEQLVNSRLTGTSGSQRKPIAASVGAPSDVPARIIPAGATGVREKYRIWQAEQKRARERAEEGISLPDSLSLDDQANQSYREILIGISTSYQNLLVGQEISPTGSTISRGPGTNSISNIGFSFYLQSTPRAITSHTFFHSTLDFSTMESQNRGQYVHARIIEASMGLYTSSGDLYRGEVGLYAGLALSARNTYLEGSFNFGRGSLYEGYLLSSFIRGSFDGGGAPDHIDVLNLSRARSGTLNDERELRYFLLKTGQISRDDYMLADIAFSPRVAPGFLTLLFASGLNLNEIHRLYGAYLESTERNETYRGLSLDLEFGYMGDNFLIRYRTSLPSLYRGKRDTLVMESHTITAGVFWRF